MSADDTDLDSQTSEEEPSEPNDCASDQQKAADERARRAQELIEELHDRDPKKTTTIRGTTVTRG